MAGKQKIMVFRVLFLFEVHIKIIFDREKSFWSARRKKT